MIKKIYQLCSYPHEIIQDALDGKKKQIRRRSYSADSNGKFRINKDVQNITDNVDFMDDTVYKDDVDDEKVLNRRKRNKRIYEVIRGVENDGRQNSDDYFKIPTNPRDNISYDDTIDKEYFFNYRSKAKQADDFNIDKNYKLQKKKKRFIFKSN